MNEKLAKVIDESIELAEQKENLEARYAQINDALVVKSE